jgi:3-oxoacyl-[acyl-carrier protein] reductase
VINISSVASFSHVPTSVVDSATKAAVDSITRALAHELGPRRIRVNSINPGGVATEGLQTLGIMDTELGQEMVAKTPLGRIGQPGDIAPIAVFLASAESGWMTGESLVASGGYR